MTSVLGMVIERLTPTDGFLLLLMLGLYWRVQLVEKKISNKLDNGITSILSQVKSQVDTIEGYLEGKKE